ncbi:4Fe-4S dicluster domain-containing protein [Turicibacter sanguinis]|nr:4Fe-4S dicluster domain-containing protein [Turicibacter sanguinis]MTN50469.1 4Fe-4S dicluster domain-containing protein [Turicibacter sanguinis]MTN53390.1 4Fe-4S dicluster domain-containing protein [Turicibacter sanguinis]MTN56752.1 4Fe-4S dicluster domain-containing protein [Turicibacter sanguinis]MTN59817.1 4Fe-4S dicluster domain-containing protein [Turicibacter sanguinis]
MTTKKLGFGFMRLPVLGEGDITNVDYEQINEMVDIFLNRGFTYFDTAYMYHRYMSESILKKTLVERHPRDSYTVATKMPTMFLKVEEDLERIFNEQLKKIGVDYFDYYLLHCLNVENYAICKKLDAFTFVQRKKEAGQIKKVGFSFHDTADVLDEILTAYPEMDFVQLQINYLDWEDEQIQSRKCFEVALKHQKEIIVMEPIKGGTLAQVPKPVEALFKGVNPQNSVASWAIRYAASLPNVMMVLSGMSNLEQILDNTAYMQNFVPFNEEEFKIVETATQIIQNQDFIPCTNCQYCVEGCPKKIAIPSYFILYNSDTTQKEAYLNYTQTHGKASDCIGCKKCERMCPQHLPIIQYLKEITKTFED